MSTAETPEPRRRVKPAALVAGGAAVVGLLVGLTTLFDWFETKTKEPPPPAVIDARLVSARLTGPHITLRQYLIDTQQKSNGFTRRELGEPGLVFDVRVRLRGHKGDKMGLQWRMFARSGRTLPADIYSQTAAWFVPSNQDHAATTPFWTPYPDRRGTYVVRFTLIGADKKPLDVRNVEFNINDVPEV
jgi:hypothetical protein